MEIVTNKEKIEKIFGRGVVSNILPSKEALFNRLLSGDRLRIYIGADPTSSALHLSHAKNYMFLEELRQLGHEAIILFGDFTAQIGDPSGRTNTRQQLSEDQVMTNCASWVDQIRPLMDFADKDNPPKIFYNSRWLGKLMFIDVINLAAHFTVQQMLERDMFQKRMNADTPIYLHEFLYPIMQGFDSVALDVDVELCGTDQTFNALAGRTLMKRLKNKEKIVITLNLMENPKTGELMSKSQGRGVFLSSAPDEMFGAIMSQPDEMIELFFVNNTRLSLEEIGSILESGPRDSKARAAYEIVKIFYGEECANEAKEMFNKTFRDKSIPQDIHELDLGRSKNLADALVKAGLVESKADWRRLIREGAVKDGNDNKIDDYNFSPTAETVLKIGKRRFVRVLTD
jgi:tyrosyl-tRNA synthetase